jgi:hypothetical protein
LVEFAAGVADELVVPVGDLGPVGFGIRFGHPPIWPAGG